ncbi:MAG: hypothetical protein COS95_09235 [Ignavibacteriales bacterium CG07_land_8_20_14_0_80_59_12]|nr:MAG: hypothetical protein COS95_09235 [Ignavibacteriales bacterium CG07_land_8_20_14_0_80_59_12]
MMRSSLRFPVAALGVVAGALALSLYPAYIWGKTDALVAVLAGGLIAVANGTAGFLSIAYAFEKPNAVFIKVIVGGMGIRLFILAGIVFVLLKVFELNVVAFTASLFFFYFLAALIEIVFMNRTAAARNSAAPPAGIH